MSEPSVEESRAPLAAAGASAGGVDLAVRVHQLGKVYRVYPRPLDRVVEWITRRRRHRPFPALEGVSFELPRGESLGIVGENGAGKSTLLKILSGISRPTTGSVEVRGRVASILELGSGFHPEFSGRDNVRINAALLGLGAAQVDAAMPDIVAFSELGDFVDRPVKVYSTGMTMRLAFSIATQVDPEVLIVDEALSVGDGYFQKKCMDRMVELVDAGTTLLFCTHAMYYLTSFCHRALWLREGRVEAAGAARDVVARYERFLQRKSRSLTEDVSSAPSEQGSAEPPGVREPAADAAVESRTTKASVESLERSGKAGRIAEVRLLEAPASGDDGRSRDRLAVEVEIEAAEESTPFQLALGLDRTDGTQILSVSTHRRHRPCDRRDGQPTAFGPLRGRVHYTVRARIAPLPLQQGDYTLYVFLLDEAGLHVWDQRIVPSAFSLDPVEYRIGLLDVGCTFESLD
ncbi:MAG: ABC transporter ATP-binding protein [Acidobacteria bacterium]|nr:MAG: ABC transporter ATP-binding protein [Acidobacteriota bacterium]REK07761.1 MAG: ABC transporter ATP-binding protein [Acidobacteriota bacterium]